MKSRSRRRCSEATFRSLLRADDEWISNPQRARRTKLSRDGRVCTHRGGRSTVRRWGRQRGRRMCGPGPRRRATQTALSGADRVAIARHVGRDVGDFVQNIRDDGVLVGQIADPVAMNLNPAEPERCQLWVGPRVAIRNRRATPDDRNRHIVSINQPAGGLRPRRPSRRRGEIAADGTEILLSCRCRDADRQFSDGRSNPPGRPATARRRRARLGALVVSQHPARLGLHSVRVKHATLSDVADAGVQRLDDVSRCGAVALLVHCANPNRPLVRPFMWPVALPRPGPRCSPGDLRCRRDGLSRRRFRQHM